MQRRYLPWCLACLAFHALAVGRAQAADAYEQDPLPDGVITVEAEHYHSMVAGSGSVLSNHYWQLLSESTASGGAAMMALPNVGQNYDSSGYSATHPRLDFRVNFNKVGTHYLIARGYGETGGDDSFHLGFNGVEIATGNRVQGFCCNQWRWSDDASTGRASFDVPSVGEHTINIWMREDGFVLDKFVVTLSSNFYPSGLGPPESPKGSAIAEEENPLATYITGLRVSNGVIRGAFLPAPGVDDYRVLAEDVLGDGMVEDPAASVYGFELATDPGGFDQSFYAIEAVPMNENRELASVVLNRLAYGPTPDLLDQVLASPTGALAFVNEQLAPEGILESVDADPTMLALSQLIDDQKATLSDLRAWYCLRALNADRQLLEVLGQFINNLFITYYWKTRDYFRDDLGFSNDEAQKIAASLEYQEWRRWRDILVDPDGTFFDLLEISSESPAMIIYLDTVENDKSAPNENYSREIMELFCMGVDNGYSQSDIEAMSPCWTGWRVGQVHPSDVGDPHAPLFAGAFLIPRQDTGWTYRAGDSEPDPGWRDLDFAEDGSWLPGQTSIGFGDNDDNTVLSGMRYNYSTLYLRKKFVVDDPNDLTNLTLSTYVDDGCIIYINTQEVTRVNVDPGVTKNFDDFSDGSVNNAAWTDDLAADLSMVTVGTNIMAIHVLNQSLNNNDVSIDVELRVGELGVWAFVFDPASHETTNKVIFAGKTVDGRFGAPWAGQSYELVLPERTGTAGVQDGYDIVAHLANLPFTEEFICAKLCSLLVNEDFALGNYYNISQITPEAQLIRDCMLAWETPAPGDGRKGNLREVLKVIFSSELFRTQAAAHQKVKTPFEYVVSAVRSIRADLGGSVYSAGTDGYDLEVPMGLAGMGLFARSSPDGWPEVGSKWIDTGTVTERLRFIQNFMMHPDDPLKDVDYGSNNDDNTCDPVALIMNRLPAGEWNDADAVVDFFIGLIFPGEGLANMDLDREECLELLNTDAGDSTVEPPVPPAPSPFNLLAVSQNLGAPYNDRVRSLVGLLLASPRFHEQ